MCDLFPTVFFAAMPRSESQRPRSIELSGKRSGGSRRTFRAARQAPTMRGTQESAEYGFAVAGTARRQFVRAWKRVEERGIHGILVELPSDFDIIRPFAMLV